jgi:NAD(P)-dependent dehydrogenase (short-subunit alcohol dehydrogenase family)
MRARHLAVAGATLAAASAAFMRAGQPRPSAADMHGRTVIVTGANSGIGFQTAQALAAAGARTVITTRNLERGRAARDAIVDSVPHAQIELLPLDLASLASARHAAVEAAERFQRVDVLVNNAGGIFGDRLLTEDGFELTIGTNHLGPYLFTRLLLPTVLAAPSGRVVTVASLAHRSADLQLDDLHFERRPYRSMAAYGQSKLANVLFSNELARRLAGTGVTSNALHPGTVRSGFAREGDAHRLLQVGVRIAGPFFVGAERAASTSVHLASSPDVDGITGRYFSRRRAVPPSKVARNQVLARRLWDASADMVGLSRDLSPAA